MPSSRSMKIARSKLKKSKKLRTYPFSKLICTCMIPISLWPKTVDPDSLHLGLHFICQRATKMFFFIEAFFPLRSCECSYRARSCQSRVYYAYICSWRYTFVFAATAICDVNLWGWPAFPTPTTLHTIGIQNPWHLPSNLRGNLGFNFSDFATTTSHWLLFNYRGC